MGIRDIVLIVFNASLYTLMGIATYLGIFCTYCRRGKVLTSHIYTSYILEDISLDIDCGDIVVTDPSCSKSTLIKILSDAIDILRDRELSVEGYISI